MVLPDVDAADVIRNLQAQIGEQAVRIAVLETQLRVVLTEPAPAPEAAVPAEVADRE